MTLQSIYNSLNAAIHNGVIDLYTASATPELANLHQLLQSPFLISSSYPVQSAALQQTTDRVILTGNAQFAVPGNTAQSNVAVTLTGRYDGTQNQFTLQLAVLDNNRVFSTFFPTLPDYQAYNEAEQAVQLDTCFLNGVPLTNVAFSASSTTPQATAVTMSGNLWASGAFASLQSLFTQWPLALSGQVTLPASSTAIPAFNLRATSPGMNITFMNAVLQDIGLQIIVYNDLDVTTNGVPALSVCNLIGMLSLDGQVATASFPIFTVQEHVRFLIELPPKLFSLQNGLKGIANLMGLQVDELVVPDNFLSLTSFYVSAIEIDFDTNGSLANLINNLKTTSSVAVTISSDEQWSPPIPFVTIKNVGTRWVVGVVPVDGVATSYTAGTVFGDLTIGTAQNNFTLNVNALIPQYAVQAILADDDSIPIGDAFSYFFTGQIPSTGSDNLKVTEFSLETRMPTRTLQATATITTDNNNIWTIPILGNVSLQLSELLFNINVTQSSINGGIEGTIILNGGAMPGEDEPQFVVSADYAASGQLSVGGCSPARFPPSRR